MPRLSEGLILHVRQHEIVWKYIIWTTAELRRQNFDSQGRADVRSHYRNEGRSEMWNYRSFAVKTEGKCGGGTPRIFQWRQSVSGEADLQIIGSQDWAKVQKRNCKSLEVQAEMKCGSGTSHLWKSWQNKCGKRNFRSLPVKAERKCGSRTSHIWQLRQSGSAEAELHILAVNAERKFSSSAFATQKYLWFEVPQFRPIYCDLNFRSSASARKDVIWIPQFCFCTRTLLFFGKSTLIQPPTHFLIFLLSYMNDGPPEEQRHKRIGMLLAKVVVNVWLREAKVDDTLWSYWHSSRTGGQAGFALWQREQDNLIMLTHLRQRFWTVTVSARRYGLSACTIHNQLWKKKKKLSHQCGPPLKCQTITRRHRLAYVQWARRHFIWQCDDWNRVLFSGETRFALSNAGGKTRKQALLG